MELVTLFLICAFFWIAGVVSGWRAREQHAEKKMKNMLGELQNEIENQHKDHIYVTIEKHEGVLYCYNKDNNSFMAQANDHEELEKKLREMFPGKRFAATQENLREVGYRS